MRAAGDALLERIPFRLGEVRLGRHVVHEPPGPVDARRSDPTTLPLRVIARRLARGRGSVGYHRGAPPDPSLGGPPGETTRCSSAPSSSPSRSSPPSRSAPSPSSPSCGRGPDSGALTGKTWQLTAISGQTPAFQGVFPPEEQALYTVAFATDGTVAAKADCNAVAGTYALSGDDGITITLGASTLVACPDGSYGTIFAHELGNVTTWAVASARADPHTADGGTGTFVAGLRHRRRPEPVGGAERQRLAERQRVAQPDGEPDHRTPDGQPDAHADRQPDARQPPPTTAPTEAPSAAPTPAPTPAPTASPDPGSDAGPDPRTHAVPGWGPGRHQLAARQHHDPRPSAPGRDPRRGALEVHPLLRDGRTVQRDRRLQHDRRHLDGDRGWRTDARHRCRRRSSNAETAHTATCTCWHCRTPRATWSRRTP